MVEDQPGKHGKPLDDAGRRHRGARRRARHHRAARGRRRAARPHRFEAGGGELPTWDVGEEEATRKAYGEALAALGGLRGDVVALDGEVSNSTHSELFREAHEDRYFEMFIAEQQMIAAAVGMQVRGWVPFASTFAAFLSRAYDFVRMAAISRADIRLSGSHAGVSIGEDGPSQMALEDIASFRAIHGSTVLHPSDANQAAKLVAAMADRKGISFMRTLRGKTEVRTPAGEDVRIGGSRVVREGGDVAIVACGITVDQAVAAAEALASDGIEARVIDCYSIKPIDAETLRAAAAECARDRHRRGPRARGRPRRRGARGARGGRRPPARAQARRPHHAHVRHAGRAAARRGDRRGRDRGRRPRAGPGAGLGAGQLLLQVEHGGEAVPVLGHAVEHLVRGEGEVVRVARAQRRPRPRPR